MIERNMIAFDKEKYKTEAEFWDALMIVQRTLIEQDYQVLLGYDDCGIYILEYAHNNNVEDWGDDRFMLVSLEEEEKIITERKNREENKND